MATTMEQRAKFRELRLGGTSRDEAMKTAYGNVAPVAPTPEVKPTPAPTTTTPLTPTQTIQGVNGEAFQVAPTNAQGLSTPAQTPAPVQPTEQDINKQYGGFIQDNGINSVQPLNAPTQLPAGTNDPVKTKTETPVIDAAQTEREKILAKNKATLEQNKQKFELAREDNAIKTTEANNALAGDQNAILNVLRSGGSIPESVKTSPYYKSAEYTYKQIQNFKTMSQGQIATALSNGALVPGTSTYNELIKDPAMEARIKEARIYATPVDSNKVLENQSSQILSQNSKVAQFLDDGLISLDEYNQMTNNSDVVAQAKYKQEKEQALNTFNKEWSDARDKAKKEFAGSAFLDSILSDIDSGYKTRADYLKGEVDIATGTLAELKGTATALFNANINEYIAYRNGQIEVDKTKATNALEIAQQAQMMGTPELAIPNTIKKYEDQGIMGTLSAKDHIDAFREQEAKYGTTLGEYISQMQKDFQAKPEYKAKFTGNLNDTQKMQMAYEQDIAKIKLQNSMKDKNIQRVGGTTDNPIYGYIDGDKIVTVNVPGSPTATGGTVIPPTPEAVKSISSRLTGNNVQCGMVTNDYTKKVFPGASHIDDTYESKVKAVESIGVSDVPQVGGIFAMNTYNSNGHTGIVQSVDLANGTFTATDANRAGSQNGGPVTTSTYKISPNFTFSNGPQVAEIGQSDIVAYNSATPTEKAKILKSEAGKQITEQRNNVFKDPNADINDILSYSQGGKTINQTSEGQLYKFSQALNQVGDLQKEISNADTGPILGILRSNNPYDTKAQSIKAQLSALLPNLARGVYGEVGVLTDNDIANYARTVPNLKSTTDVNNAILAMTLQGIANGYKAKLQSLASAGYDVSGYEGIYSNIQGAVDGIIGGQISQNSSSPTNIPPAIYSSFESDYNDL